MASHHDHSYKLLFSHPEMVKDLLTGFVKEAWVAQLAAGVPVERRPFHGRADHELPGAAVSGPDSPEGPDAQWQAAPGAAGGALQWRRTLAGRTEHHREIGRAHV